MAGAEVAAAMGFLGKAEGAVGFSLRGRRFGARFAGKHADALRALGEAALAAAWRSRSKGWLSGGVPLGEALAGARADAEAAGIPPEWLPRYPGALPVRGEVLRVGRCSVEASTGSFAARFGMLSPRVDREFCSAAAEALRGIASRPEPR